MIKTLFSSALLTALLAQTALSWANDEYIHVSALGNLPEASKVRAIIAITLDSGETKNYIVEKCVEESLSLKIGPEAETGVYNISWYIESRKNHYEAVYRPYDVDVFDNNGVIDALPEVVAIDMSTYVGYHVCKPIIPTTSELMIR